MNSQSGIVALRTSGPTGGVGETKARVLDHSPLDAVVPRYSSRAAARETGAQATTKPVHLRAELRVRRVHVHVPFFASELTRNGKFASA